MTPNRIGQRARYIPSGAKGVVANIRSTWPVKPVHDRLMLRVPGQSPIHDTLESFEVLEEDPVS